MVFLFSIHTLKRLNFGYPFRKNCRKPSITPSGILFHWNWETPSQYNALYSGLLFSLIMTRRCQVSYSPDNNTVGPRHHHRGITIIRSSDRFHMEGETLQWLRGQRWYFRTYCNRVKSTIVQYNILVSRAGESSGCISVIPYYIKCV